ncbi:uncharacterized protein PV09_08177 [Verruconis gallopava]|uniref:Autophagy-related protein 14 n=1 Tax=Verruconis gallopava TaxID=253628 RepID=A0A0D1YHG4_9PEZI|nr:uncharacterized protein PV09_08177 [Verruconis gallopava]KIW00287.1 hypothetical protein PV09_08177 [Verruconis gallopava]
MTTRHQQQDSKDQPADAADAYAQRGRPWLYPYNRRLRHLHGISIRNLALSLAQTRPRGNTTVDDAALPTSLRSPAKALAQQEQKTLEHSRSITDLKALAESEDSGDGDTLNMGSSKKPVSTSEGVQRNDASPSKRPPTLRRLRRRSTIDWQNSSSLYRQKKLEDAIGANMADVFFSLHVPDHHRHDGGVKPEDEPVYISEVVPRTMNPDFRFFDLNEAAGPAVSRGEDLVVKVWARNTGGGGAGGGDYQFLLEMHVNLRSLQFIGKSIEGFTQPLPQNCVLFHMKDGVYTSFLDNFTGGPSSSMVAPPPRTLSMTQVLPSSSYDALMRLGTLDECIQDALATRARLEREINAILDRSTEATREMHQVGVRMNALEHTNEAVHLERRRLAAAKRRRDELRSRLAQRRDSIQAGYSAMRTDGEKDLASLAKETAVRTDELSAVAEETLGQRRRICEDLQRIYPITPLPHKTLHFAIASLPLPNSPFADTSVAEAEATAAALGHVALLVDHLQYYLSTPLPYPVTVRGSTSTILDPISEVAGGAGKDSRVYPLFGGRGPRFRFEFGVFLLNKNVERLSERLGLRVLDLRQTLPNLKYLLYVATAGSGEVPERKKGGIRGFLRTVPGADAIARRDSLDSQTSDRLAGLMPPPPRPTASTALTAAPAAAPGNASPNTNGRSVVGNGKLKAAPRGQDPCQETK